ncbi:alpha/beta-type small acid-soluble spore protein [Gorillibacterium sp. CAU 1737]|uniref:alpha/beta-type small acid-soluble spore protein n=1 Tax=Gorillibacterium sp. CAU 1737 TaxID=3140362 RepID=UPI003261D273
MSRRSRRRPLVPDSEQALSLLKAQVMAEQGYTVDRKRPDDVKYEVADDRGIPLQPGRNGGLTTEEAGRVGGPIGGAMVRELVRMAKEHLVKRE